MPKSPARILLAGAVAFGAYVMSHPRGEVRKAETLTEATHSMAVESAWVLSHVVGLLAVLLISTGLVLLLRAGWLADDRRARAAAWLLAAGALAAAIEMVPHIVVARETPALAAGGSTPITDLHFFFQATLLPIYGLGMAALAVTGFGRVAHPIACVLGIVGGAALTVVGPLLALTGNPALGVIFMPAGGTIVFAAAMALRLLRSPAQIPALVTA